MAKLAKGQSQFVFFIVIEIFMKFSRSKFLKDKYRANLFSAIFARNFSFENYRPTKFQNKLINNPKQLILIIIFLADLPI